MESAMVPGVVEDDFESIEVMNTHPTQTVNLLDMSLANGLCYTFGNVTLAPGQRQSSLKVLRRMKLATALAPPSSVNGVED
jgi:hypothetical protein